MCPSPPFVYHTKGPATSKARNCQHPAAASPHLSDRRKPLARCQQLVPRRCGVRGGQFPQHLGIAQVRTRCAPLRFIQQLRDGQVHRAQAPSAPRHGGPTSREGAGNGLQVPQLPTARGAFSCELAPQETFFPGALLLPKIHPYVRSPPSPPEALWVPIARPHRCLPILRRSHRFLAP